MVSRLIKIAPTEERLILKVKPTTEEFAFTFIDGMGETQRERFKRMLESNIKCGLSVAETYGIDYEEFIAEVKKQMGVK